jgi:hypothetical protein
MKRGLIISLYSSGRERVQQALELSIQQDLVEFDLLRLDPVATISELAEGYAKGYDYALKNGYEFVGHIDDDDLVVPGCFTFLMKLLDKNRKQPDLLDFNTRFEVKFPISVYRNLHNCSLINIITASMVWLYTELKSCTLQSKNGGNILTRWEINIERSQEC